MSGGSTSSGVLIAGLAVAAYQYGPAIVKTVRSPRFRRFTLPSNPVILLLGLHTAVFLYCVIFPPFSLFVAFGIDVGQPGWLALQNATRSELCVRASPAYPSTPHSYTQLLATKLSESRDQRRLYAELGHEVFTCSWCRTKGEYLLAKLPGIGFWYLGELGFLRLLSQMQGNGGRSNSQLSWTLGLGGAAEIAYRWFGVPLFGSTGYVSDSSVCTSRILALAAAPLLFLLFRSDAHHMPPTTSQLIQLASSTHSALLSADLITGATIEMHQAVLRNELLRDLVSQGGVEAARESRAVRADDEFRGATAHLNWEQVGDGMAGNNSKGMRMNAKVKVGYLWKRMAEIGRLVVGATGAGAGAAGP